MIQRPQTLYFLAIVAISMMLMFSDTVFYTAENANGTESVEVEYDETALIAPDGESKEKNSYISMFLVAHALLAAIALMAFKNRKLQVLLSSFNYLVILGLLVMMYMYSLNMDFFEAGESGFTFFVALPLASVIFNAMAIKGVKRDEQLIRSMDRLR